MPLVPLITVVAGAGIMLLLLVFAFAGPIGGEGAGAPADLAQGTS